MRRREKTLYDRLKNIQYYTFENNCIISQIKGKLRHQKKVKEELKTQIRITRARTSRSDLFCSDESIKIKPKGMKAVKEHRIKYIKRNITKSTRHNTKYNQMFRREKCTGGRAIGFDFRNKRNNSEKLQIQHDIKQFFYQNEKGDLNSVIYVLTDTYIFSRDYIKYFNTTDIFYCVRLNLEDDYIQYVIDNSHEEYCDGAFLIIKDKNRKMTDEQFKILENKEQEVYVSIPQFWITKDIFDYCKENNLRITPQQGRGSDIRIIFNEEYYKLLNY